MFKSTGYIFLRSTGPASGAPLLAITLLTCSLLSLTLGCGRSGTSENDLQASPRIINGQPREDSFFEVSQLYIARTATGWTVCTGAWVGSQTLLTAAHCVIDPDGNPVADNAVVVITDTAEGLHTQTSNKVVVHPDYSWPNGPPSTAYPDINLPGFDAAVVFFPLPFTGVPAIVSNQPPEIGQILIIAGYGVTSDGDRSEGTPLIGLTPVDNLDSYRIFWRFDGGLESNTCRGDSGGPAYIDFGSGARLVGITSGGTSANCRPGDISFETRIDILFDWLRQTTAGDLAVDEFVPLSSDKDNRNIPDS